MNINLEPEIVFKYGSRWAGIAGVRFIQSNIIISYTVHFVLYPIAFNVGVYAYRTSISLVLFDRFELGFWVSRNLKEHYNEN